MEHSLVMSHRSCLKEHSLVMSHLLFAGDTLIFCDTDLDQHLLLRMVLI